MRCICCRIFRWAAIEAELLTPPSEIPWEGLQRMDDSSPSVSESAK